jgi:hypothetical protein
MIGLSSARSTTAKDHACRANVPGKVGICCTYLLDSPGPPSASRPPNTATCGHGHECKRELARPASGTCSSRLPPLERGSPRPAKEQGSVAVRRAQYTLGYAPSKHAWVQAGKAGSWLLSSPATRSPTPLPVAPAIISPRPSLSFARASSAYYELETHVSASIPPQHSI